MAGSAGSTTVSRVGAGLVPSAGNHCNARPLSFTRARVFFGKMDNQEATTMMCPVCDAKMRTIEKHGVEVDICPDCKGVWLDRGELDKIIQMTSDDNPKPRVERESEADHRKEFRDNDNRERHYDDDHRRDESSRTGHETGKSRKRESLLSDIFGMFGGGD